MDFQTQFSGKQSIARTKVILSLRHISAKGFITFAIVPYLIIKPAKFYLNVHMLDDLLKSIL